MPINIYTVTNDLENAGWKLLSTSYKNLNTELEMQCPKGHKQLITYGAWRKNPVCAACLAGDTTKAQNKVIPKKDDNTRRILALDAATSISGFAIYDNETLVYYNTFKTDKTKSTTARINEVKKWLMHIINEYEIDFLGLENI